MKNDRQKIYQDIIEREPDYTKLEGVSEHAIEFIKHALKKDQSERATIAELLQANWIVTRKSARVVSVNNQ